MAAFTELDWSKIDVHAIVACRGIATIEERRQTKCLDWLRRNSYEVESLDCSRGVQQAVVELGRMLRWQQQFGYTLGPDSRNLDALRDGFEFEVSDEGGKVFELVRPDVVWQQDSRWLFGLLAIAEEVSRREIALGRRFVTLLILPENSPLIGQVIEPIKVPVPFWNPYKKAHEFE